MHKPEFEESEGSTEPAEQSRLPWVTPTLVKINAGSAENGFSQNNNDGQFTKS